MIFNLNLNPEQKDLKLKKFIQFHLNLELLFVKKNLLRQ
jgi:hypothetical protein